jgi:hypothetical protein
MSTFLKNKFLNLISVEKLLIFFILIFISLIWSLLLFRYWNSDYGLYYNSAVNISDQYRLYKELLDNKGPLYHFFINAISKFIGVGVIQAYLTLALTLFSFFFCLFFIIFNRSKNNYFLILFLSVSILFYQNTNLSLPIFQCGIVILSFYFLLKSFHNLNNNYLYISFFLYVLSFFTKVDVIVYMPVYFITVLLLYNNKKSIFKILTIYIFFIIEFLFVYLFFSKYFDFSFYDYYIHNFEYNFKASSPVTDSFIKIFRSPVHIGLIMSTGIGIIFVEIFSNVYQEYFKNFKSLFINKNKERFISLIIIFLGVFFWLWAGSDKNYHVFMIYTPMIFFIAYYWHFLKITKIKLYFFYIVTIFYSIVTIYAEQKNSIKNGCFLNKKPCGEIIEMTKTIDDIKINNYEDIIVIGNNGWLYLLSNTKPTTAIGDWFFYLKGIKNNKIISEFDTDYLLITYNKLLQKKSGYIFWMHKSFIDLLDSKDYYVSSDRIKTILSISTIIEDQGSYMKLRIK